MYFLRLPAIGFLTVDPVASEVTPLPFWEMNIRNLVSIESAVEEHMPRAEVDAHESGIAQRVLHRRDQVFPSRLHPRHVTDAQHVPIRFSPWRYRQRAADRTVDTRLDNEIDCIRTTGDHEGRMLKQRDGSIATRVRIRCVGGLVKDRNHLEGTIDSGGIRSWLSQLRQHRGACDIVCNLLLDHPN